MEAIIRASDNPRARLLMLEQWRAGLRQGQQVQDRADAPRAAGRAEIGPHLWEHQRGEARGRSPVDGLALGQGGGHQG